MSSVVKQGPQSQLVDDVEGTLRDCFKHNLHDEGAKQTFLKASLQFLYRKLEKRLENFSSRSDGNVSIKTQSDSPHRLPSLGYQDKVRHWVSKCLHAGGTSRLRTTSVAEFTEQFHIEGQDISRTKLCDIDVITHSSKNPKVCTIFSYSKKTDSTESYTTSVASSEGNVLVIMTSGQGEIMHENETCVSTVPSTMEPHLCTKSLEVTGWDSKELGAKEASNSELLKWDDLVVPGVEYTRTHKYHSQCKAEHLGSVKDEVTSLEATPSNSAFTNARDEVMTSEASSTKEVQKSSRSSRIHAAILHLFGSKKIRTGCHCSKRCKGVGVNSNIFKDGIKSTKGMPHQRNAEQNARKHHDGSIFTKSNVEGTSSISSYIRMQKLAKLKVCKIPSVPACQSCEQIRSYLSSRRATRDVATYTEEQMTGYCQCKRCTSGVRRFKRTAPCQSESILSGMRYTRKLGNLNEVEELRTMFLYSLLKDIKKCNKHSLKVNSKSKRRFSRFTDIRRYGTASWPLNTWRHRELQKRTEVVYKESPGLLRQPSKFSAWYGDEKSSDSDDEDNRPGGNRLLLEQLAELVYLFSDKKLRPRVNSSLLTRSSHASEHIPSFKI